MLRNIRIDINNLSTIDSAIKELEEYRDSLDGKLDDIVDELRNEGELYAKNQVQEMDNWGTLGELVNSITSDHDGKASAKIYPTIYWAKYVEFGTGLRGTSQSHPLPPSNWTYSAKGWWYPAKPDTPNPKTMMFPWGFYAWTWGMPSRPFMWNTATWLYIRKNEVIREFFK